MICNIEWIQKWYQDQCNKDWEHQYGVKIDTLDNPGWKVTIDLVGTKYASRPGMIVDQNNGDLDWIYCYIIKSTFKGMGDPSKLDRILSEFRKWCESSP